MSDDLVSVVIVDFNAGAALRACLASLGDLGDVVVEIVVVDHGAMAREWVQASGDCPKVRVIVPGINRGFAAGANLGIEVTRGDWIALVNPDTVLAPRTLTRLISFLKAHPRAAAVSPILRWPDGTAQPFWYGDDPSPVVLVRRALRRLARLPSDSWEASAPRRVDWVSGACLVARRSAFASVGPLDEQFFLYFEDVDWCRRSRQAGWEIWIEPRVSVIHASRPDYRDLPRRKLYRESLRKFYRKHYGPIASVVVAYFQRVRMTSR